MTASVTSLTARRAITTAESILDGARLKPIAGSNEHDMVAIPAELLRQLIVLARGATEIAEFIDVITPPPAPAPPVQFATLHTRSGDQIDITVLPRTVADTTIGDPPNPVKATLTVVSDPGGLGGWLAKTRPSRGDLTIRYIGTWYQVEDITVTVEMYSRTALITLGAPTTKPAP